MLIKSYQVQRRLHLLESDSKIKHHPGEPRRSRVKVLLMSTHNICFHGENKIR